MTVARTLEPQYDAALDVAPVVMGPMASHSYRNDPKHLGFTLARYKFVARMLAGYGVVAEIGCGDGFASQVVRKEVGRLVLFDFDEYWMPFANQISEARVCDPTVKPLYDAGITAPDAYDAIYMIDVLEHIRAHKEAALFDNLTKSLRPDGVFIVGTPSLESQKYASASSAAGHVNCKSGITLKWMMQRYFKNVFLFGMNDEMIHVGFSPMCHYLFALCAGVRK
jgi:cyclopropane fatty-acyl-phospholipid synthase-like methyltransferase